MLGFVDLIDYDGDRVRRVTLRFPSRDGGEALVREVTTCERIGQGAFGTVYRATCHGYPLLALKISTGKTSRLNQELEVLRKVCTRGRLLLPRFEFGALNKAGDLIVIGMELCVPCTLHDLLLSTRLTGEADMLYLAHQAVQSVAYVHEEGCIHRDIKLQNFVFDLDGNLKLIDFGLACSSMKPPAGDVVAGTVSFMAPEMAHNALFKEKRVSVGAAGDIWSLGIVLFSIFTQRNPYPAEGPGSKRASRPGSRSTSQTRRRAPEPEEALSPHSLSSGKSTQKLLNERLLRRVAAGDWQWPVGSSVASDLKQIVDRILVKNPDERPTVKEILSHRMWNLRRRSPPAALTAFLGVQDDFFMSHDEAHLMRAVEQRSAGVAASLQSRAHTPDNSLDEDDEGEEGDDDAEAGRQRRASLKIVAREEGAVGGVPAVQVYDVRASARKRSRPIRDISQVIAEETSQRQPKSKRASRARDTSLSSAQLSRAGSKAAASASAAPPPDLQNESSTGQPSSSSTSGNLSAANAGGDETGEDASRTANVAVRLNNSGSSEKLEKRRERGRGGAGDSVTKTVKPRSRAGSEPLVSGSAVVLPTPRRGNENGADGVGEESSEGKPAAQKRRRSASSLRQPSSSLLEGVVRGGSARGALPTSRPTSRANSPAMKRKAVCKQAVPAPAPATRPRSPTPALSPKLQRVISEEAAERLARAHALSVEHAWLLASFRLTIEEDQERYSITWLAQEQAKSASHPHKFKEMTQVTSKKYQYGFVCDMCDYEWLPQGRSGKDLHFFHCQCGRDLCPECYVLYQEQCTCACCGTPHANSIVLRDHLLGAGSGRSLGKKTKKNGPSRVAVPVAAQKAAAAAAMHLARGAARSKGPATSAAEGGEEKASATTRRGRPSPKVSIAAMHQRATGGAGAAGHFDKPIDAIPDGPWRPFARMQTERAEVVSAQPTPEEREALLGGEWLRHFHLYPPPPPPRSDGEEVEEPYAFVYHAQPGRTGAVFLTSEFPMHSAVFSMLERQFFVVDHVDTAEGDDHTRTTSLLRAKAHPDLGTAFHALQEIVAYDTNMMKQRRAPGTVSVYQAPRSAYSCNGDPFLYVRWFRFNHDRSLSAFLLSNGAVQVFVNNEFELRWFDETRKFLVRCNGVCELVNDSTFTLAPAINQLLYESFDV